VEVKLLLDTNRLSDALAEDEEALDRLEAAQAIYVPVVVLGELRSGFLRGSRPAKNETRLQWFLSQPGVFTTPLEASTSHQYAHIHRALQKRGKPIPTNDLWIAALAIEHGLVLFTRDAHFQQVPGLACC
jgi:predicted nucleic acid-binding protein